MPIFHFILTFADDTMCSDDMAETIYDAGDDSTVASSCGVVRVRFHRDSDSPDEAIRCAIETLRAAGYSASGVEIERETFEVLTASA